MKYVFILLIFIVGYGWAKSGSRSPVVEREPSDMSDLIFPVLSGDTNREEPVCPSMTVTRSERSLSVRWGNEDYWILMEPASVDGDSFEKSQCQTRTVQGSDDKPTYVEVECSAQPDLGADELPISEPLNFYLKFKTEPVSGDSEILVCPSRQSIS